jgi:hypothetical protein
MGPSAAVDAARSFLSLVWDGPPPTDAELAEALDGLALAYHQTPECTAAEADLEPPAEDGSALYEAVRSRFPEYGYYPIADPGGPMSDAPTLADAIDDIADLTRDLREVVWRAEHLGSDDAAWCFRLLYFHWGAHMRSLALYLHARQFG